MSEDPTENNNIKQPFTSPEKKGAKSIKDKLMKQMFLICIDLFKIYDVDQSGYLDREEMAQLFKDLTDKEGFPELTNEKMGQLIEKVDINNDGNID